MTTTRASTSNLLLAGALLLGGWLGGCGGTAPPPVPTSSLAGTWRGVLASPGGELPFTLRLTAGPQGVLQAAIVNGDEAAPISTVERQGSQLLLRFEGYDSELTADLDASGKTLTGRWRKTISGGDSTLPFTAQRDDARRFRPAAEEGVATAAGSSLATVAGTWAVTFSDEDGTEAAQAELAQDGTRVTGTFLTPTGDYRFLDGSYEDGLLRLSAFDGAHAFLFHARGQADGSLAGDFWSRDSYHATWTAQPAAADAELLPDAWSLVGLRQPGGGFHFRFPDLDGNPVAFDDPRFAGKVLVVNIFGSWCPNCNDEAPLLAQWYRRFRPQGLEMVGLAYEVTGDAERDRTFVRRYATRHGIEYPLLLAGTSDKSAAADTLPDLSAVVAFPTTVFIGRDGKVRRIHTGFAGPGTGRHYQQLQAEFEGLIEELLAEPSSTHAGSG